MLFVDVGGTRIPKLGLGTWQLDGRACRDAVAYALSVGYRLVDTAQIYGNETQVGGGIRDAGVSRADVFVISKLWRDNLTPRAVHQSTRESLKRLALDYIDLLLIHWPNDAVPLEDTLGAMMDLRQEGLIVDLGVSNFTPRHLERALICAPVIANQIEYHPYLGQRQLLDIAHESGTAVLAYCPLARGRVTRDATLRAIGERHGKSAAQVALRWLMQQPGVCALPKAASTAHLDENLAVFDFELTGEEMGHIAGLECGERLIDPPWAPDWSAQPSEDVTMWKLVRRAPRTEKFVGLSQPASHAWVSPSES